MISGGGTGGHVYPALAVLKTLEDLEVLWVGSETGMEKTLVSRADLPYAGIAAGGLRGKNPIAMTKGFWALSKGYRQSKKLLKQFKPDVLFVTGGYVCVPMTLAAHRAGIPVLIYLPDIEPGQAIKFLSRFATKIAVTAPPAQDFFPAGLTAVTGYPVRAELYKSDKGSARAVFGLERNRPTLLVFGGSQGARSINRAIAEADALSKLLVHAQLIHVTGTKDATWANDIRLELPAELQQHYHLYDYLHTEMPAAFNAADLIVSRAGASILGEAPAAGTPSILIPYPYSGAHQWANARYMVTQGAAIAIPDVDLGTDLVDGILSLLKDEPRRAEMAIAAQKLAKPTAAQTIGELLQDLSAK